MTDWMAMLGVPSLWRLIVAFVAGGGLGLFYFGGLWWTVRRLETAQNVGLLFFASIVVRMAITVGGFYVIAFYPPSAGSWLLLLAALTGFMLARLWLTRRLGPISDIGANG